MKKLLFYGLAGQTFPYCFSLDLNHFLNFGPHCKGSLQKPSTTGGVSQKKVVGLVGQNITDCSDLKVVKM